MQSFGTHHFNRLWASTRCLVEDEPASQTGAGGTSFLLKCMPYVVKTNVIIKTGYVALSLGTRAGEYL